MPAKKYIVRLSSEERQQLRKLVKIGRAAAYKRQRAQILLKADIGKEGPGLKDHEIAQQLEVGHRTVERIRQRFVEQGFEKVLERAVQKRHKSHALDGEKEAYLVALSCGEPPDGRNRWTLKLLAKKMVELEYVDSVYAETVRKVLKKRDQTLAT
jgi:transposase